MNKLNEVGRRSSIVIVLAEKDILVDGDELMHVSEGEITVYSDGFIDASKGEFAPIDKEAVGHAIAEGNQIFNMEEIV